MKVAVLGAGAGGASAVAELQQKGFATRLWNRNRATLEPFIKAGGIRYTGVLGEGRAEPDLISDGINAVLDGAETVLVCLPTLAHAEVAEALAAAGANRVPVVLNPGHSGSALEFTEIFRRRKLEPPPTAEFSTLTYVARKSAPDTVWTTNVARRIWVAALPGGGAAVDAACRLYPAAQRARDVLFTSLCNVNMILHPPGAILGAAWVESTGGDFTFYVQGLSDGVARVMDALDAERLKVGEAFGHNLPSLFDEMQAIGTIEAEADPGRGLAAAVRGGTANQKIRAPDSIGHRYYREDFWYGLLPFLVFAGTAGVDTPVARSLMHIARALAGPVAGLDGRTAEAMGIANLDREQLLNHVREH